MNSSVMARLCQAGQRALATRGKRDNEIEWDPDVEVLFSLAMIGLKPVGVNKHFMMLLIHDKFSTYLDHQVSSKLLWDYLDTLYDMAALHESEIVPFPNEEVDFELPEECYDLLNSEHESSLKHSNGENESTKNGSVTKSSKKIVSAKLKQGSVPVPSKIPFASPLANKPLKSQTVIKSDIKTPTSDSPLKVKQESGSSVKTNKIKHSPSPLPNKTVKSEPNVVSIESSPDIPVKKNRERGNSPAITKKQVKVESSSSGSSKKPKSETTVNVSRPVKEQTPDSVKKVKSDKDISKKGKLMQPVDSTPVSKKSSKEGGNGGKKKNEPENNPKKTNETSSAKYSKSDAKSSSHMGKGQDVETPPPSGSRKSSSVKVKSNESAKKLKGPKPEEPKKGIAGQKRRRVT